MVAVVAAAGDGRRLSRLGPGLHPRCGPCSRWVWIHGWCSNCAEHWHSPALTPRDARGPSTKLIHHIVVELLPEKRADTGGQPPLQGFRSTFSWGSLLSFFAFKEGMLGTPISVLGGWPTVSGGFVRQVFITTRTLPF